METACDRCELRLEERQILERLLQCHELACDVEGLDRKRFTAQLVKLEKMILNLVERRKMILNLVERRLKRELHR